MWQCGCYLERSVIVPVVKIVGKRDCGLLRRKISRCPASFVSQGDHGINARSTVSRNPTRNRGNGCEYQGHCYIRDCVKRRDSEKLRSNRLARSESPSESYDDAKCSELHPSECYERKNTGRRRAQRQSYSNFARAFGDAAGKHAINAHSRKRQGHDSERLEESERELPFRGGDGDQVVHRFDAIDWQLFVDGPDRVADVRSKCRCIAARPHHERHTCFDPLPLIHRRIHRVGLARRERHLFHVAHYADNRVPTIGISNVNALPKWIYTAEPALRERLA